MCSTATSAPGSTCAGRSPSRSSLKVPLTKTSPRAPRLWDTTGDIDHADKRQPFPALGQLYASQAEDHRQGNERAQAESRPSPLAPLPSPSPTRMGNAEQPHYKHKERRLSYVSHVHCRCLLADRGSHGLMTILLWSWLAITSSAAWIWARAKRCEITCSVSTKPDSIKRMALDIAKGVVPKLASMRPSRK